VNAIPLQTIAQWAGGRLVQGDGSRTVTQISTDSRTLQPGDLFVALTGENFDGHLFVEGATATGAAGAVVLDHFDGRVPAEFALIEVGDTLAALQAIARAYRATLPLSVVGITGSNGKTSTKDFTAAVLGARFKVIKTEGNLNNHIGLPLTILRATSSDEIGVFEMGMNHPGEIAPLAAMAAPKVGIVTNVGVAHIEFMGSREGIAREKGMLAEALPADGVLVLSAEDDFSESIARRSSARTVFAGIDRGDVSATVLETGFDGSRFIVRDNGTGAEAEARLPVPGLHMIQNALLAIAAGLAFGVGPADAVRGLAECRLTKGRLERKMLNGINVLDDSYNANPDSMRAALRTLVAMPAVGARVAVLGRMGELGVESLRGHRSVGEAAAEAGVDALIAVGDEALAIADAARASGLGEVYHVPDTASAAALLSGRLRAGDTVLIKGSRTARMERILDHPLFQTSTAGSC